MAVKKNIHLIEIFKNLLLLILVINLIVLMAIYIGETDIYQSMTENNNKKAFDKIWSVQSDYSPDGLNSQFLLPEFIGYKLMAGEPVCTIADRESATELYRMITPCIKELFGRESYCEQLDVDEGEKLFLGNLSASEFIYVRYHVPVLYQLIYAYSSEKITVSAEDTAQVKNAKSGVYVSEMIIVPEKDVAAHRFIAFVKDGEGNYYRFTRNEGVVTSEFHISKLADESATFTTFSFEFAENNRLGQSQPVVKAELDSIELSETKPLTSKLEVTPEILRIFGYNPDKLSGYYDNDTAIYYDSDSRIRLEPGKIDYRSSDPTNGVDLHELIGYSVDENMSLFDKLAAIDHLLSEMSELSADIVGGEAVLCLGEVYSESGLTVFEYFYTYNNIRISGEPAIVAKIGQNRLCSLSYRAVSYSGDDAPRQNPEPEYIVRKLIDTDKLSEKVTDAELRYLYDGKNAEWQLLFEEN